MKINGMKNKFLKIFDYKNQPNSVLISMPLLYVYLTICNGLLFS